MQYLIFSLFAAAACALPATVQERASGPTVMIKDGSIVGSAENGVDSFKGIPFAQPPVGPLRLKPPQPLNQSFGTFDATKTPATCPQFVSSTATGGVPAEALGYIADLPFFQTVLNENEDCLTINVQRPSNPKVKGPLPVVFWIFGGGFEVGGTQLPPYNGGDLIRQSSQLGSDVIYVAVNYRVAGFGFLAGKELQQDGSTNLGLRDQRLGLQWVADNIAAFGGDPNRVTIWGESAGSISVFDHLVINGGDNTYNGRALFKGGIMNSGSAVPAMDVTSPKAQEVYDMVVEAGGCSGASDTLNCLRELPYEKFQDAANSPPGIFSYQSLDLSYLPRPDPHDNFFSAAPSADSAANTIADVPLIIGDMEDEGTLFSLVLLNITTTDELVTYIQSYFPMASHEDVQGLVDVYPEDPRQGSPFNTGYLNILSPQYKRIAALLGDITFTLTRRATLNAFKAGHASTPVWSYLGSWLTALPALGTLHAADLLEIYFGGLPSKSVKDTFFHKYISFINFQEPNHFDGVSGQINWPEWTNSTLSMLHLLGDRNEIIKDDFRQDQYNYIVSHGNALFI